MHQGEVYTYRNIRSNSRSRKGIALPKINRTFCLNEQAGTLKTEESTYLSKVGWVVEGRDYTSMSTVEIEDEYRKLRDEIVLINREVARGIQGLEHRPMKRTPVPLDIHYEMQSREYDNNLSIIERLRRELQNLQRRANGVTDKSSDALEEGIRELKEKIQKNKNRNKELKLKSKQIGNSIQNTDNVFEEARKLEIEHGNLMSKKAKLEDKNEYIEEQNSKMLASIEQIAMQYQQAEEYMHEATSNDKQEEEINKYVNLFRSKKNQLEILHKNVESYNNMRQQKYHQTLKSLECFIQGNIAKMTQVMKNTDQRIKNSRAVISKLEEVLQSILVKPSEGEVREEEREGKELSEGKQENEQIEAKQANQVPLELTEPQRKLHRIMNGQEVQFLVASSEIFVKPKGEKGSEDEEECDGEVMQHENQHVPTQVASEGVSGRVESQFVDPATQMEANKEEVSAADFIEKQLQLLQSTKKQERYSPKEQNATKIKNGSESTLQQKASLENQKKISLRQSLKNVAEAAPSKVQAKAFVIGVPREEFLPKKTVEKQHKQKEHIKSEINHKKKNDTSEQIKNARDHQLPSNKLEIDDFEEGVRESRANLAQKIEISIDLSSVEKNMKGLRRQKMEIQEVVQEDIVSD